MNFKDSFDSFCSKQKKMDTKYKFNKFLFENTAKFDLGFKIARTLTEFTTSNTPFALLKGGLEILKDLTSSYYPDSLFSDENGWKEVKLENIPLKFFSPAFSGQKFTQVQFGNPNYTIYYGKVYHTDIGDIGYADIKRDEDDYASGKLYFRPSETTEELFFEFLIENLLKSINSKFISLDIGEKTVTLISEEIYPIPSERAIIYAEYIKKCVSLGINRSILMYGPPGTGKTTLSQSIINELGFKTLKFRYNKSFNFNTFKFLLDKIKVDAIIIDDFDQASEPEQLLEFLEVARKKTKLIIGVVNSLKSFHPAILRPGRFDEIVKIDMLEANTVKSVLGNLHPVYGEKVKNWPIAYINELVIRSKLVPRKDLLKNYRELQKRVMGQLKDISEVDSKKKDE